VAAPETLPDTLVIVVVPTPTAVAKPFDPAALLSAAIPVSPEIQVTNDVMSCVVLSEYEPVAVNVCEAPIAIEGLPGVTEMDTSIAGVTVSVVDPEILPSAAEIVVEPAAIEVATPLEPAALLIVAEAVVDDDQVTAVVRSCVVLSE
jgi:hypothetical protein